MVDHRRRQDHRREGRDRSGGRERWVCHFPIRSVLLDMEEEQELDREREHLAEQEDRS